MATIKEVAKRAGVSVGTVSNALSGVVPVSAHLRERVQAAATSLDYHPNFLARSLKTRQTQMLGMVISDLTNPFFPQVVRGAEDAALEAGYLLITFNTDDRLEREKQVLSVLRSRRVDGVLLVVAPSSGDVSHIEAAMEAGLRIVCLDRVPAGLELDSVSVDNIEGARVCVQHMIMLGHREIAIITGSLVLQTASDRLEGYKQALRDGGIELNPEFVLEGDFRTKSGHRLAKKLLLRAKRPTALFVSNGMMAVGALQAIEEMGVACPDDIAIAAFDDLWYSDAFRPHLTAVAQPGYEMGFQAAQLLIERLEGRRVDAHPIAVRLDPELKIRESTGRSRPLRSPGL